MIHSLNAFLLNAEIKTAFLQKWEANTPSEVGTRSGNTCNKNQLALTVGKPHMHLGYCPAVCTQADFTDRKPEQTTEFTHAIVRETKQLERSHTNPTPTRSAWISEKSSFTWPTLCCLAQLFLKPLPTLVLFFPSYFTKDLNIFPTDAFCSPVI